MKLTTSSICEAYWRKIKNSRVNYSREYFIIKLTSLGERKFQKKIDDELNSIKFSLKKIVRTSIMSVLEVNLCDKSKSTILSYIFINTLK